MASAAERPVRRLPSLASAADVLFSRRGTEGEGVPLVGLIVLTVGIWAATVFVTPTPMPVAAQTVPVVLGNLVLGFRSQVRLFVVVVAAVVAALFELGVVTARVGSVIVVLIVAFTALRTSYQRERLGLRGISGDQLLADLRDRLAAAGSGLVLPPGWNLEVAQRLSGGSTFGGDFLVSGRRGNRLEIALVDVSGKGAAAATRALQLSGALGGLIGSVAPSRFLAAANAYVLRQGWEDGFATAVHLTVDTDTGAYVIDSAGHPPAALFVGDSGRWTTSEASGPVLGVVDEPEYDGEPGTLHRGDALLIYTDGVVEVSGEDLSRGIDRLLGAANRLVVDGFANGGARLLDQLGADGDDDRAVAILWRA